MELCFFEFALPFDQSQACLNRKNMIWMNIFGHTEIVRQQKIEYVWGVTFFKMPLKWGENLALEQIGGFFQVRQFDFCF